MDILRFPWIRTRSAKLEKQGFKNMYSVHGEIMNNGSDLMVCAWNSQIGSSPHQAQSQSDVSDVACVQQVEDIGPFLRLLLYLFSL